MVMNLFLMSLVERNRSTLLGQYEKMFLEKNPGSAWGWVWHLSGRRAPTTRQDALPALRATRFRRRRLWSLFHLSHVTCFFFEAHRCVDGAAVGGRPSHSEALVNKFLRRAHFIDLYIPLKIVAHRPQSYPQKHHAQN